MKDELEYIGKKIVENSMKLAKNLEESFEESYTKKLQESGMPLTKREHSRTELLSYFGEALYSDHEEMLEKVADWSEKTAKLTIDYEIPLSDALRALSFYRAVIWDVFTEELEQRQFAPITMLDVSKIIDPLIDKAIGVFGEMYENDNIQKMKIAYTALEELSVPVVPIAEGIAVLPIVGEIDTHRAKLIMDNALHAGNNFDLDHLILDVSGVPIIDTMVSDQIFQILNALNLTGIEAIITGIRPELAQTIGNLGLNYKDVKTRANMHQALIELGFKKVDRN
ncbi:STAS domain-containing protein [Sediminibacillus massiliensis]|uniref:STAS domain-containing protein n=1 Tax=Sediminibacillus massiliensis TaxID=1926277 RepID=UPI00098855EB|nr:STAS domain-containing protein [Sediminibacillus massiliensis]